MKKSFIRRLFGKRAASGESDHDASSRDSELENLEPRMLFSAAPVEAPDQGDEPQKSQAAEESVIVVSKEAANVAAISLEGAELESANEDGLVAAEHSVKQAEADTALTLAETDLSEEQNVTLVNVDGVSAGLNEATLEAVAEAAKQRWIDSGGLSGDQVAALDNITYEIADLDAVRLGSTDGYTVSVDGNAWGRGWFIDATPLDDSEFGTTLASGALSADGGIGGQVDLLTVLLHEQGHILGLGDNIAAGSATGDVSSSSISAGTRLLPTPGQAAGLTPGAVEGPSFVSMTFQVTNLGDSGAGSLRQAILDANANVDPVNMDFIEFTGGGVGTINLTSGQLTINDPVTINSTNAAGVIIDAGGTSRVFEVQGGTGATAEASIFQDLTITGGLATGGNDGGGVFINGFADVTFDNVLIDNNEADEGGGFYVAGTFGATVTLTDSTIDSNIGRTRGGGFRNSGYDTVVTMTGGAISNNDANNEHGGGFYNNGKVVLTNVDITGNEALALDEAAANRVNSYGGGFFTNATGLHPNAGQVTITGGSITDNDAYGYGGGFWNRGGKVTIDGTSGDPVEIQRNAAGANPGTAGGTRHGGGFWNTDAAETRLTWVNFDDGTKASANTVRAVAAGGAIADVRGVGAGFYQTSQSKTWLTDVSISNHLADTGGAFYQDGIQSEVHGLRVTLDDNIARVRGGAFRNATTGGLVELTDSSIDGNTAYEEHGGGVYNNGTLNLDNTDISNSIALDFSSANRRDAHGGGLYNGGGTVNMTNGSDIRDNTTYGMGGGLYNTGGTFNMTDGVIDGNHIIMDTGSTRHGGGFWNQAADSVANLHNVVISNNETGKDTPTGSTIPPDGNVSAGTRYRGVGGGFWNTDGSIVNITGNSQLIGNKAEEGGAFYNTSTGSVVNITGTASEIIEIDDNYARVRGGGFRTTGNTTVNLSYVDVTNNITETQRGGGFYADGAQVIGDHVRINDNRTGIVAGAPVRSGDEQGGGFWADGNGKTVLVDSEINNNEALQTGGGAHIDNGILELTRTTVDGNFAFNSGGGLFFNNSARGTAIDSSVSKNITRDHGGGFWVEDDSSFTATRTNIDGNLAGYEQDGVSQRGGAGIGSDLRGGGFWASGRGSATLIDSTLNDNEAARYGGGGNMENESQLILNGTTVANNVADNHGGGFRIATNASIDAVNSTISGNYAGFSRAENAGTVTASTTNAVGGGFWAQSGGNVVDLNHVTIAENKVSRGGVDAGGGYYRSAGTITIENGILFGNIGDFDDIPANQDATDIRGDGILVGANVIGVQGNGTLTGNTGGRITTDPLLGALADNGGPLLPNGSAAFTHSLGAGSSAIDAAIASTLASDQRDDGRTTGSEDLGAFEAAPLGTYLEIVDVISPETVVSGSAFSVEGIAVTAGAGPITYSWEITASGGGSLGSGTGSTASLSATLPGGTPTDAATLTLTASDGTQSASTSVDLFVVDPMAMPTAGTGAALVTTAADGGAGSLRDAISQANASGAGTFVITFAAGIDPTLSIATAADENGNVDGDLDITKTNGAVSIVGNAGPNTTIDGGGVDRVFDVRPGSTAYFTNLTITGGATTAVDHGAGLRILGANAIFKDVDITGNEAITTVDNVGGGIYMTSSGVLSSRVFMTRGSVADNKADSHGGGIYLAGTNVGETLLHLTDTVISGNSASDPAGTRTDRDGGGLYITDDGNRVVLNNVSLDDNTTRDDGGGAYFTGADMTIEINGGSITRNFAGDNPTGGGDNDGGGFFVTGTRNTVTLTDVTVGGPLDGAGQIVMGNHAEDEGGGFRMEGRFNTVNLIDTILQGNRANDGGGGFYNVTDTETINITQTVADGSKIIDNFSATEHGGGFRSDGILTITGSNMVDDGFDDAIDITGNQARFDGTFLKADGTGSGNADRVGGGFYLSQNGVTTLTDVKIDDNIANRRGGGFYISGGAKLTIDSSDPGTYKSTVSNNHVVDPGDGDGGGFYATTALTNVTLNDVVVDGNTSTDEAGGFYLSSNFAEVNLTNVDLTNNTSQDSGGGFYNASNGSIVNLDNVLIDGNRSVTEHGGGFRNNGIVDGKNVTITKNDAGAGDGGNDRVGGGFYNPSGRVTLVDATIDNNVANARGGGFYSSGGGIVDISSSDPGTFRSSVSNNKVLTASNDGGGFYQESGGTLTILNGVDVNNNQAGDQGGGIFQRSDMARIELTDVTLDGNIAGSHAGGIRNESGWSIVTVDDVRITNNTTTNHHAGGIWNRGSFTGQDLIIDGNVASTAQVTANSNDNNVGGGFWNNGDGAYMDLTRVEITNNKSHGRGGGFYNDSRAELHLTDFLISGNSADQGTNESQGRGGGFWNSSNADVILTDGTIDGNESYGYGGGFAQQDTGSTVTATDVTFSNNRTGVDQTTGDLVDSREGGGFYSTSTTQVNLDNVTIRDNISTGHGGGFRIAGGTLTGTDVIIDNNTTLGIVTGGVVVAGNQNTVGGGFYLSGNSTIADLTRVEITNNDSFGRGGGFYSANGFVNLTDFIIRGNTTDQDSNEGLGRGGGFFNVTTSEVTLNRGEISENKSFGHGGGFYQEGTNSKVDATNVTISNNLAGWDRDDGVSGNYEDQRVGGGFWAISAGLVNLNHVTIANNETTRNGADGGSGFRADSGGNFVNLENSIVYGNLRNVDAGPGVADDIDNRIGTRLTLIGANVVGTSTGNALNGVAPITTDPLLGPLQDNGGIKLPSGAPARTHALALYGGSVAIDAAVGSILTEDQRSAVRPEGAAAELGAYEVPRLMYVDATFTGSYATQVDGDLELADNQFAYVGINAFDSLASLEATYPTFAGDVILNGGTYGTINLSSGSLGDINLQLVQDLANTELDVEITTLTGDSGDSIETRFHGTAEADLVVDDGDFDGGISGSGSLTKVSTGTLTLSGASTYSGGTSIGQHSTNTQGGTLKIEHDSALGTGQVQYERGGVVELGVSGLTVANNFFINNWSTDTRAIRLDLAGASTGTLTGDVRVHYSNAGDFQVDVGTDDSLTMSGKFYREAGGGAGINKLGDGTLVLTGNSAIPPAGDGAIGAITVNGGTMQFNTPGSGFNFGTIPGASSITVNSGATLDVANTWNLRDDQPVVLNGGTLNFSSGSAVDGVNYANDLTLNDGALISGNPFRTAFFGDGSITVGGSSASTISADIYLVNNVDNTGIRQLNVDVADVDGGAGTDLLISGVIRDLGQNGTSPNLRGTDLVKAGGGTMELTGNNSYTGSTDINAGTLVLTGFHTGAGAYTVGGGATLTGDGGTSGTVTATATGTLEPGTGGVGDIGTGALTLDAGSNLIVDLGGTGAGASDQVVVTGTVDLTGSSLGLFQASGYTPVIGDTIILIDNDGGDAVTGTFGGQPEGAFLSMDVGGGVTALFTISYVGGDGNDVAITAAVAMPTTTATLSGTILTVTDTELLDTNDNLNISVVGSEWVIRDPDNILGGIGPGFSQTDLNEIRIDTSLVTGLNVLTLGGDDRIAIGDLGTGLQDGITVDGGAGFDNILYTGVGSVLPAGGSASFTGEEVEFQFSDLITTDGDITLNGTGGTGSTHQGIHLYSADLTANGAGNTITLNGSGGDTGNSNQGVWLTDGSTVTTADGNIDIDGQGGGDAVSVAGQGVMIYSGSSLSAGGSGTITIDGIGSAAGTFQNEGVVIDIGPVTPPTPPTPPTPDGLLSVNVVNADGPTPPDGLMNVQVVNTGGPNPGNNSANWLNLWTALDGGAGPTGTVAGYNVLNNTADTETVFDYAGGGGNYGTNNAIGTIAGDGPGGGGGPFAPGGTGGSNYSIRSQAFLKFNVGGTYTIALGSDDGRRIELTEATAGSAPGFTGFSARGDQVNGAFTPGDTVVGFSGGTGHNQSVGVFTVAAGDILELDAFYYEGGGGDSGEISIAQGTFGSWTSTTDFQLLQSGLFDIEMESSNLTAFAPSTTNPGNNTANWLDLWTALDGGAGPTGLVAGYTVLSNTTDTETVFDYAGNGGDFGTNNAIGTINNDGPGGGSGPFAPVGTAGTNYSIRTEAYLKFTASGTYTIAMGSDDGRRIELTDATPGGSAAFNGFSARLGQVNGAFSAGDTVVGFSGTTGHDTSLGVFTVAAGDVLKLDAFYYEGGGGDSGEISIASGSQASFTTTSFSLLQNAVHGIQIDSSDLSALATPLPVSSAAVSVENGDMAITGTGGGTLGGGAGVSIIGPGLKSTGTGNISIIGNSAATGGSNNIGVNLRGSTVDTASGSGSVTISGRGSDAGKDDNMGVSLRDTDITVGGAGTVTIDGTGGSGEKYNHGVHIDGTGSSITSVSGAITIDGTGNGSLGFNRGIRMGDITMTTGGDITLTGTGSATGTRDFNTGIYLNDGNLSAGTLTITGHGGTGSSFNDGVRLDRGSLTGMLNLNGTANAGTIGLWNTGAYLVQIDLGGIIGGTIDGTGGGGAAFNHGIYRSPMPTGLVETGTKTDGSPLSLDVAP